MSRITRLALLLLLALPAGCAISRGPRAAAPMPLAPPLYKRDLPGYSVHGISWLGNDRLVFDGRPAGGDSPGGLYLWDLQGAPRRLLERSLGACVTADLIRAHTTGADGKAHRVALRPPDFKPVPLPEPPKIKGPTYFDRYTCTVRPVPARLRNHYWSPLAFDDGYLDFGAEKRAFGRGRSALWLASSLDRYMDTGIRLKRPFMVESVKSIYDGKYLVYESSDAASVIVDWRGSGSFRIWRINVDRRAYPIDVPIGPWTSRGVSFLPVRPGLIVVSREFSGSHLPLGAGAYLRRDGGGVFRLERGFVQEPIIAPNGCRLAYIFKWRLDQDLAAGANRVVVVDVCKEPLPPLG